MRHFGLFLVAILIVSAVVLPLAYFFSSNQGKSSNGDEFFFGVTYGQDTVEGAKLLIDKVKDYTNVFVVDSSPLSNNKTALDAICSYAAEKNLHFIVYFFSLYSATWQQEWVTAAKHTWGDKFLGVYLRDEPGGRQIELAETVENASSPSEAADKYIQIVSSTGSMIFLKDQQIPVVASDFALYWYDYQAGFDVIFAELGWNNSRTQEIALCRGAATMQGKEWGTIITWTYQQPPYIESGPEAYQDMVTSYDAGAKYILIFNYPQYPETNQYGILDDEHFLAMQQFWDYAKAHPRDLAETRGEVALVLPKDYGGSLRNSEDKIWGLWPADNASALILENVNTLVGKYGLKLDIVYDVERANITETYSQVYFWNETSLP